MTGYVLVLLLMVFEKVNCAALRNDNQDNDPLLAVVTLFRHGDRSPSKSFPNDPYFNKSYWPMGYGQLTNKGKARMYELGKWFRQRYNSFLPEEYSPEDIYVRSTDPDRCLMTAYSVLAGLYPPKNSQMWNKIMPWQPIPVHTVPIDNDEVLSMSKVCLRYQNLLAKTLTSCYVKKISSEFSDFIQLVSKYSGWNNTDVRHVATLQTNFDVYSNYNSSFLPIWNKFLDQKILLYLAGVNHQRYTLTPKLKRLRTGPFWSNFFNHFDNVVNNDTVGTPKFLMFSAHDTTIVSLLNCMGVYDFIPPKFGATLIWELRKNYDGIPYISVLYKKSDDKIDELGFKECEKNCEYSNFKRMLEPLMVSGAEWEEECKDDLRNVRNEKVRPCKKPFFT